MSVSKGRLLRMAILAIMSVSLVGSAVYYFVPESKVPIGGSPGGSPVFAFILGEGNTSGEYYTLIVYEPYLSLTFMNDSNVQIYPSEGPPPPTGTIFSDESSGEVDATQLKKITLGLQRSKVLTFPSSIDLLIVGVAENRTISTYLIDEATEDMGSQTIGCKDISYASNNPITPSDNEFGNFPSGEPVLETKSTGYWSKCAWEISLNQLGNMLSSGLGTANITFTFNVEAKLKYKAVMSSGNMTGSANLEWSGPQCVLQLLHEGSKITLVRYSIKNIKLNIVET